MTDVKRRWDWAWKVLCNPEFSWGKHVISELLGRRYDGYTIKSDSNSEIIQPMGDMMVSDKFLIFGINDSERIIHLEFQSAACKTMALRMLIYGTGRARAMIGSKAFNESYSFPDSYLVNVRKQASRDTDVCILKVSTNAGDIVLQYPVIEAYERIPEIGWLANSDSSPDIFNITRMLVREYDVDVTNVVEFELFTKALTLLCKPEAYEAGISDAILKQEVDTMRTKVKAYDEMIRAEARKEGFEEGREEGFEEGHEEGFEAGREEGIRMGEQKAHTELIRNVMRLHNCSEADARKFLGLFSDRKGLSKLDYGKK